VTTQPGAAMSTDLRVARLQRERKVWHKNKPCGFKGAPVRCPDGTSDIGKWRVTIPGPPNTPWADGFYTAELDFPAEYPLKPPNVKFDPPIQHPNVYANGAVCLTLINSSHWKADTSVLAIIKGLQLFLAEPNENDPANWTIGQLYISDRAKYNSMVREYAAKTKSEAANKKKKKKKQK